MQSPAPLQLAIIGSGPSGCYLAQSLLRALPTAAITVFDALPSPYGLVRYGVAADHQHTKAITRQFERLFAEPRVTFAGNLNVGIGPGTDLDLDTLRHHFDAVALATGLAGDRRLGIPGDALPEVYGSGVITRILNSHPGEAAELPPLGENVVIVGGGNVAIDLLRFLVKDRECYEGSDIADHALDGYLAHPAARVTVLIRSSADATRGDPQMLKELAAIPRARYLAPELAAASAAEGDRTGAARLAAFAELTSPERAVTGGPQVMLRFGVSILRILGKYSDVGGTTVGSTTGGDGASIADGTASAGEAAAEPHVTGIEFTVRNEAGRTRTEILPASAVLTAIGFEDNGGLLTGILDAHGAPERSESGRIAPGLYRAGWAKHGPVGAIPANRTSAKDVADEIVADIESGALEASGRAGFAGMPEGVRARAVSYEQWQTLDRHEQASAASGRVRQKCAHTQTMLAIARGEWHDERTHTP